MAFHPALSAIFLAAFEGAPAHDARLDAALEHALTEARATWPGFVVSHETYVRYLALRASHDRAPAEALALMHTSDLYLACACVERDPRAVAELDRSHLSQVAVFVQRIDSSPAFADDLRQYLSEDLLVGRAGGVPGLSRYSGRGPLAAFVRLAAVRGARYLRRGRRDLPVGQAPRAAPVAGDVELELLKRQHGAAFQSAFASAIAALDPDVRAALKMHFLDGMRLEAIAALYRVNKSTVSRWITRARHDIFAAARRILAEQLALPDAEVDSLMEALQSRLDVTMRWFL